MTIVTLDSNDTAGILADAGITLDQPEPKVDIEPAKVDKTEAKVDKVVDLDDEVDENGMTAADREGLTERTRKAVGKQHRLRREAEEYATAQYNERKLAEQRATNLEQELAALKAKTTPAPVTPKESEPPQRENFANENAYVDAMIQYGVDKRLAEKAEEDRAARVERERNALVETAKVRIDRASELVPDFADVVGAIDTAVPPAVAGYMQKSEMFAELAYHFAKNSEMLVSLAKLPPDEQLVKIGKIESTLSPFEPAKEAQHDDTSSKEAPSGKAPKAAPSVDAGIDLSKPRSKPAPVFTPLEGSGSAGASKDSKDMNVREAIEDYAKRNRTNLNARKRH